MKQDMVKQDIENVDLYGPASRQPAALGAQPAATNIAIGVCTFRRLAMLERGLPHVAATAARAASGGGLKVHVLIVDNDGQDPAVATAVAAFARAHPALEVRFAVEVEPGISAARNRVFEIATEVDARFLAMLDDDEWPSIEWLDALLAEQGRTGASVVGGPVSPVFGEQARHLERHRRFWSVQKQFLNGRPFVFCSCNFLIDLGAIANVARPLFDPAFGLTGGEDTAFFRGLFFKGHRMAWAEEAVMFEDVPAARANLRWMRRRHFGSGNSAVHWERPLGRGRVLLKSLGLSARLLIYPALGREPGSRWLGWLLEYDKVRGRLCAHLGIRPDFYGRPVAGLAKTCR